MRFALLSLLLLSCGVSHQDRTASKLANVSIPGFAQGIDFDSGSITILSGCCDFFESINITPETATLTKALNPGVYSFLAVLNKGGKRVASTDFPGCAVNVGGSSQSLVLEPGARTITLEVCTNEGTIVAASANTDASIKLKKVPLSPFYRANVICGEDKQNNPDFVWNKGSVTTEKAEQINWLDTLPQVSVGADAQVFGKTAGAHPYFPKILVTFKLSGGAFQSVSFQAWKNADQNGAASIDKTYTNCLVNMGE